ncbi:MAG: hypothetical protein ACRDQU_05845 [Pseudonocardiaceae bacterium]
MSEAEREQLARKYFIPLPATPVGAYVALTAGAAGFLLGIVEKNFFGFLLLVAGLFGLVKGTRRYLRYRRDLTMATPRATDAQIDGWRDDALENIIKSGRDRLNVHPTELGPQPENRTCLPFIGIPTMGKVDYKIMRGADGTLRFSVYKFVVVYLSDWRLPVYVCHLDIATGATFSDSTKEYALNHVEGMETVSDRLTVFTPREVPSNAGQPQQPTTVAHHTNYQAIQLKVSGENVVELWIGISANERTRVESGERAPVESAIDAQGYSMDRYISALREHLRTRNHGAVGINPGLMNGNLPAPNRLAQIGPSQLGLPGQLSDGSTQQPGLHPSRENDQLR